MFEAISLAELETATGGTLAPKTPKLTAPRAKPAPAPTPAPTPVAPKIEKPVFAPLSFCQREPFACANMRSGGNI